MYNYLLNEIDKTHVFLPPVLSYFYILNERIVLHRLLNNIRHIILIDFSLSKDILYTYIIQYNLKIIIIYLSINNKILKINNFINGQSVVPHC